MDVDDLEYPRHALYALLSITYCRTCTGNLPEQVCMIFEGKNRKPKMTEVVACEQTENNNYRQSTANWAILSK